MERLTAPASVTPMVLGVSAGTIANGKGVVLDCNIVHVLLVEDNVVIRELIQPELEDGGFTVVTAVNGDSATAILGAEDTRCRALVTDVDLGPGPTGCAIAARARELVEGMPVVYMTGGHAYDWASKGVPNSILVDKPFAPTQILTAVSQLLNSGNR